MTEEITATSQDVLAVDLKTAARMLGLTEGAVRKQLALGKRDGMKNDRGQWVEVLVRSDEVLVADEAVEAPGRDGDTALLRELLAEKDRRLHAYDDEIAFLRLRVQNLEMLLGQSLQNQKALLPPEPPKPEEKSRGFWPWGRKNN